MAPILPPDHKPIPTGIERAREVAPKVVRAGALAASLSFPTVETIRQAVAIVEAVKPPENPDDPLSEDHSAPEGYDKAEYFLSGVPSTGDSFDWPRARRAGLHPSQMQYTTDAALLFDIWQLAVSDDSDDPSRS